MRTCAPVVAYSMPSWKMLPKPEIGPTRSDAGRGRTCRSPGSRPSGRRRTQRDADEQRAAAMARSRVRVNVSADVGIHARDLRSNRQISPERGTRPRPVGWRRPRRSPRRSFRASCSVSHASSRSRKACPSSYEEFPELGQRGARDAVVDGRALETDRSAAGAREVVDIGARDIRHNRAPEPDELLVNRVRQVGAHQGLPAAVGRW